jgi:A/G-specific adenine glycosylase
VLPGTVDGLLALPGIGEYTAGAIASIAFGQQACAVDGNVLRVLSRMTADAGDITLPDVKKGFRVLALSLLPKARPGDFNQALMDLGAIVCLPNGEPLCGSCPVASLCAGHREGIAGDLPVKAAKKPREIQCRTVFVILCRGRVLLKRRPAKGLLAGLWELPGEEGWLDEAQAMEALRGWGARVAAIRRLEDAKHIFTHVEWLMRGWLAESGEFLPEGEFAWADSRELKETFTVPSAFSAYGQYFP